MDKTLDYIVEAIRYTSFTDCVLMFGTIIIASGFILASVMY